MHYAGCLGDSYASKFGVSDCAKIFEQIASKILRFFVRLQKIQVMPNMTGVVQVV